MKNVSPKKTCVMKFKSDMIDQRYLKQDSTNQKKLMNESFHSPILPKTKKLKDKLPNIKLTNQSQIKSTPSNNKSARTSQMSQQNHNVAKSERRPSIQTSSILNHHEKSHDQTRMNMFKPIRKIDSPRVTQIQFEKMIEDSDNKRNSDDFNKSFYSNVVKAVRSKTGSPLSFDLRYTPIQHKLNKRYNLTDNDKYNQFGNAIVNNSGKLKNQIYMKNRMDEVKDFDWSTEIKIEDWKGFVSEYVRNREKQVKNKEDKNDAELNGNDMELELQRKNQKKIKDKYIKEIISNGSKMQNRNMVDEYLKTETWENVFMINMETMQD